MAARLYYVSDDFFQPISYGVVLSVFGLFGTQFLSFSVFVLGFTACDHEVHLLENFRRIKFCVES